MCVSYLCRWPVGAMVILDFIPTNFENPLPPPLLFCLFSWNPILVISVIPVILVIPVNPAMKIHPSYPRHPSHASHPSHPSRPSHPHSSWSC